MRTAQGPTRPTRTMAAALVLAVSAGGLTACGGGAAALPGPTGDALHANIEAVRTAVEQDRTSDALKAVSDLRASVRRLADRDGLDAADAKVLLVQIDRIAAKLAVRSSPKPTPTPTAEPPPEPKVKEPKNKGAGKANGKGRKK